MIRAFFVGVVLIGAGMSAQSKTFVVDVREDSEIEQTGKVQGALVQSVRDPGFLDFFKKLSPDGTDEILIYCRSGKRAGAAKELLEQQGFKDVKNLGGYQEASQKLDKPLVK